MYLYYYEDPLRNIMKPTLKLWLWRKLLPEMLELRATSIIPRTGDKAKSVNVIVIYLYNNNKPLYLLDRLEGAEIIARVWDDVKSCFDSEIKISYEQISSMKPEILYYYGSYDFRFDSIFGYLFRKKTKFVYFEAKWDSLRHKYSRYRFSRKELIVHERVQILRKLVDYYVNSENANSEITVGDLLSMLYTSSWYIHPKISRYRKMLELNLDSLVISGDIQKSNKGYKVTGKAIESISRYELEESRYDQQLSTQKVITSLTFAIVFLTLLTTIGALVQAHIIEVPTLLDFGKVIPDINLGGGINEFFKK